MSIIANREHRDLTDRIADIGGIVIPFDVDGSRPPTAASPHLTSLSDIATTTSAEVDGSLILTGAAPYVKIGGVAKAIPYSGGTVTTGVIAEAVTGDGVLIDGLRIKDAAITPVAGGAAWADLSACATGEADVIIADNLASAFELREAANSYVKVITTNSAERTEIRAPIPVGPTATAITGATALTIADSGRVFTVSQAAAYDIDVPAPVGADWCCYLQLVAPGANNVTVTVAGSAATFEGVIVNDVTSVIPATGATLTFATGAAVLGDYIEVRSTSASKYFVRAVSSAAGGITIA